MDKIGLAVGAAAVALTLTVQAPAPPTSSQVFTSRVESVRIDALVTDGRTVVTGLGPDDFEVFDNGVRQRIDLLAFDKLPLNIALALDVSGSVTGERLTHLKNAARAVIEALEGEDKIAVITFSRSVGLLSPLSGDRALAMAALERPAEGSDTSLVDATLGALVTSESDTGRALTLLFSDGADTSSFLKEADVVATAKRGESVVYAAAVSAAKRSDFLRDVTSATGGRLMNVESIRDLRATFLAILSEFRQRYLMSFTPEGVAKDGWHRLEVRVKQRRVVVSARSGYQRGAR